MIDKEYIRQKVQTMTDDLALLADFESRSMAEIFTDPMGHHAFNNILQQIIQRAIDINYHIIADTDPKLLQSPASYRETFELLGKIGVLPPELAQDIVDVILGGRLLSHEGNVEHDFGFGIGGHSSLVSLPDIESYLALISSLLANEVKPNIA